MKIKRLVMLFLIGMLVFWGGSLQVQANTDNIKVVNGEYGVSVGVKKTNKLTCTLNGESISASNLSYKSSNTSIVTVSSKGALKGKKTGKASIKISLKTDAGTSTKVDVYVRKCFTIGPSTKPYKNAYISASTYNANTKQYYTIRSYLEYFEKCKGGILILKKGTYKITNVLYVPSNVTIMLSNGTAIKKSLKTNSSSMKPSGGIFELIEPSKSAKKGVYGKYNGVHNVQFIGEGNATIDQVYVGNSSTRCISMVLGHNKNILISGIHFRHLKMGHFIEMDASKNVIVRNCSFSGYKASETHTTEAVNLDTPDKKTNGFNHDWSKYDCTANQNVVIESCTFNKLERALGTHQYSKNKYHKNITISNCVFKNCVSGALTLMNWRNVQIMDSKFVNIGKSANGAYSSYDKSKTIRAILVRGGVKKLKISGCNFKNMPRVMQCMPWQNQNEKAKYPIIYNSITDSEYKYIAEHNTTAPNTIDENFIIVNTVYQNYSMPKRYYFDNTSEQ